MNDDYRGRLEGFHSGVNGETFVRRFEGYSVAYRIAFCFGYCEGSELRSRLAWM